MKRFTSLGRWIGVWALVLGVAFGVWAQSDPRPIPKNLCGQKGEAIKACIEQFRQQRTLGHYDSCLIILRQAHGYVDTTCRDPYWHLQVLMAEAFYYSTLGDMNKSMPLYEKVLVLAEKTKDSLAKANAWYYAGVALRQNSQLERALDLIRKSEVYYSQMNLPLQRGRALFQTGVALGFVRISPKLYELVSGYYRKAIEAFRQAGSEDDEFRTKISLAHVCLNFKQYKEALTLLDEVEAYLTRSNIEQGLPLVWKSKARIFMFTRRLPEAYDLAEKAYATTQGIKIPGDYNWLEHGQTVAEVSVAYKKFTRAIEVGNEVLKASEESGQPRYIVMVSTPLAEAYAGLGQYQKAYEMSQYHQKMADSIQPLDEFAKLQQFLLKDEVKYLEQIKNLRESELKDQRRIQYLQWGLMAAAGLLLLGAGFWLRNVRRTAAERARQSELIAQKNEELQRMNSTRQTFFSLIAHDLRGPISNFVMIPQLVNHYLEKDDRAQLQHLLALSEDSFRSTHQLLESLLEWSLTQTGSIPYEPQPIPLEVELEGVLRLLHETAQAKNIRLERQIEPGLMLWADRRSLATILRNVVSNALKFSHPDTQVSVSARSLGSEGVEISIRDQGLGMDAQKIEHVLVAGQSRRTLGTAGEKGAGIGLLLTRELVGLNQGHIEIRSQPGQGTEVVLRFPSIPSGI